jgi:hypothetical protein
LAGDREGLAVDYVFIRRLDRDRRKHGEAPTGLADQILDLDNSLIPSRREYLAALAAALDEDPDPALRRRIEWRIATDRANKADRLLSDARHNRVAALINDAARPLGQLASLALSAINPAFLASAAIDSLASTAVNVWRWQRPRAEERQALSHYRQHFRRDGQPAELRPTVHRLRRKIAAADCSRKIQAASAAAPSDPVLAGVHLRAARAIRGCESLADEAQAQLKRDERERTAAGDKSLWPRDPLPSIAAPLEYRTLLVGLLQADPGKIRTAARRLREHRPESDLLDEALYAETVAADLEGNHEAALDGLRGLARDTSTNMGQRAEALLHDPAANPMRALRDALSQHQRARARYVLFGGRPSPRTALHGAARTSAGGLRTLQTFGIFNVIGLLGRAVTNWRRDPIANAPIIAAGEELLARRPDSPHVPAVHEILAAAYERERAYAAALFHYRLTASPDDRRVSALTEKAANRLLEIAEAARTPAQARTLLLTVERRYPGTRAAGRAHTARAKLVDNDVTLPAVSPDELRANPALARQLGLPAAWLDGRTANGEVGGDGVQILGPDRATVGIATPEGEREESITLSLGRRAALDAAISEAAYLEVVRRADAADRQGSIERFIPFFVQGSIGEHGISVFPGIKPRAYAGEERALYAE